MQRKLLGQTEILVSDSHPVEVEWDWLRFVADYCTAGIVFIEPTHDECTLVNRRASEMFALAAPAELSHTRLATLLYRRDGTPFSVEALASRRALGGHVVAREEQRIRRLDGHELSVLVSASPIYDERGSIRGAVMVIDDLTTATEIEQLRDEWIGIVAHDLRQPITVIMAYASMIEKMANQLPEPVVEWSRHILSSSERLKHMTRDLLDSSALDAKRLVLNRIELDLASLVKEIVQRLSPTVQGHSMRVSIHDPIPLIRADPQRVEQVMGNLISNAVKYGYPDTEIRISLMRHEASVRISVQNRGDGITPEDQQTLFGRFRRSRGASAGRIDGLGLGLHIARGLVEAHGGRMWVKSIPSRTTTFHFTLPVSPGN